MEEEEIVLLTGRYKVFFDGDGSQYVFMKTMTGGRQDGGGRPGVGRMKGRTWRKGKMKTGTERRHGRGKRKEKGGR